MVVFPFNHLYIIQAQTFGYETNYDPILKNILDAHFLMHFVSFGVKLLFLTLFIIIFDLRLYKSLVLIMIQKKKINNNFNFFCNGSLWLAYHKNILTQTPPPKKEMTCFYTIFRLHLV
jgi:hypothetical protein